MSVLAYGLILLGCADDGSACQKLDLATTRYVAAAECRAEIPAALMGDAAMRADYPVIEARCVPMTGPSRKTDRAKQFASR